MIVSSVRCAILFVSFVAVDQNCRTVLVPVKTHGLVVDRKNADEISEVDTLIDQLMADNMVVTNAGSSNGGPNCRGGNAGLTNE